MLARMKLAFVAVVLAALTSACEDSGPASVVEIGQIMEGGLGERAQFQAPATAAVGESFAVSLRTLGSSCVEAEDTDVELVDLDVAVVTPYDRRRTEGTCLLKLCFIWHRATVTFDTAGMKLVVFRGRNAIDELIDVSANVLVE